LYTFSRVLYKKLTKAKASFIKNFYFKKLKPKYTKIISYNTVLT
jgi:hypothetical protein